MSIENDLYKQLKHLVSTVPSCNFISYEDKKDIIQDVMIILLTKMEDGTLVKEFEKIKGYSFLVLRNYCSAFRLKEIKRETPVAEFWEVSDTTAEDIEKIEYRQFLHEKTKNYIQQAKYSEIERKLVHLLLDDRSNKEINEELNTTPNQLKALKFRIGMKLKYDVKRPIRFLIKNVNKKNFIVPCFSVADVKNFFSNMTPRNVTHFIYSGYVTKDGYYVEKLFEDPRGRKKKTT